jgi:hypothetical protein
VDLIALERRMLRLDTLASRLKLVKASPMGEPLNDKVSMLDRSGARSVTWSTVPSIARSFPNVAWRPTRAVSTGLLRPRAAHTLLLAVAGQPPAAARIYW